MAENLTVKEIKNEKQENSNKVELVISTPQKTGRIILEGKGAIKEPVRMA